MLLLLALPLSAPLLFLGNFKYFSPGFFLLPCSWNTELDRGFGLFMRSNKEGAFDVHELFRKATLFWISPHFGKYSQALPYKSLAVVVGGTISPPGPKYKTHMVSTAESEQSYTLFKLFFWTFKAFIWCKLLCKCKWARSLILEQNSSHVGCRCYSRTYSKRPANTSICWYILEEVSGPGRTNLQKPPLHF